MLWQLCSKSSKNTYKEVQILTELKLNPCTGTFKDFVLNYCELLTILTFSKVTDQHGAYELSYSKEVNLSEG